MGSLHIVLGPMFSGKTTHLIDIYKNLTKDGKKVCVINYSGDTRYDEHMLSTHAKIMIPCIQLTELSYFNVVLYDCILINEGQFFKDLKDSVLRFVEKYKKDVYVVGLDGDYCRSKFGSILDLIPYCDSVVKLNAKCTKCGKNAIFTNRISNETQQFLIGSSEMYKPSCRECFIKQESHSINI